MDRCLVGTLSARFRTSQDRRVWFRRRERAATPSVPDKESTRFPMRHRRTWGCFKHPRTKTMPSSSRVRLVQTSLGIQPAFIGLGLRGFARIPRVAGDGTTQVCREAPFRADVEDGSTRLPCAEPRTLRRRGLRAVCGSWQAGKRGDRTSPSRFWAKRHAARG